MGRENEWAWGWLGGMGGGWGGGAGRKGRDSEERLGGGWQEAGGGGKGNKWAWGRLGGEGGREDGEGKQACVGDVRWRRARDNMQKKKGQTEGSWR